LLDSVLSIKVGWIRSWWLSECNNLVKFILSLVLNPRDGWVCYGLQIIAQSLLWLTKHNSKSCLQNKVNRVCWTSYHI